MFIDYTATRELVGSGTDDIETEPSQADRVPIENTTESVSLSGANREVQLNRYEYKWVIATVPVASSTLARWREWHASVIAGETFTLDVWGTQASPDNAIIVSYIKGTYQETLLSRNYYQIRFEALER